MGYGFIKEVNQWGCFMPRSARLDAPGILHHVMGRGIEKGAIFLDAKGREDTPLISYTNL